MAITKKGQVSAEDVANYFINLANKKNENDLTNLKLQKLLYFSQGVYLAEKGKTLFEESIEAWSLGPVVRNVYDKFKECGAFPITDFDEHVKKSNVPKEVAKFLSEIWEEYGKFSASHLVDLTHESGSPWKEVFTKGENKEIPPELMAESFSDSREAS